MNVVDAFHGINRALLERLRNPARGVSSRPTLQAIDFSRVSDGRIGTHPFDANEVIELRRIAGISAIVCPVTEPVPQGASHTLDPRRAFQGPLANMVPSPTPLLEPLSPLSTQSREEASWVNHNCKDGLWNVGIPMLDGEATVDTENTNRETLFLQSSHDNAIDEPWSDSSLSSLPDSSDSFLSSDSDTSMSSDRDTDSDSDYTDSDKTSLRTSRGRCQCSCRQNVPIDVRCRIHAVKLRGQSSALKLLAHVFGRGLKIEDICHIHLRRLAGGLGLKTNFSGSLLRDRLARVYENRKDIRVLTTGNNTFSWFRRDSRPVREEDLLSAYRFSSIPVKTFSFDARAVFGRFLGRDADGIQEAWHSNGSITVPGIFRWWWESQSGLIAKIVQDEFDMYDHHLQASNGKPNYGWLRNMFHSLAQQLMRQDPVYYALYCALRPDQAWRLISYPRWIETGVGGNLIQGSMSLDDEDELNTTELLMGMHHHLHTWWALVEERGLSVRAPVIRITDAMYTAEDQDRFGCRWTAQPCKAGDVRITSPLLPHGSTGPATRRRRTMLPWFVAIGDDHLTLDVQESGTWEDLAAAHRNLECAPRTPSGKPVLYAKAPYRFPAATELMNLGALSDALVGRRQWTSPAVMAERDLVLGRDDKAALAYVENWRKNALFYCRDHDVEPVSG